MILHSINKHQDCLQLCLSLAKNSDAILLLEDGVYAARNYQANEDLWDNVPTAIKLYALDSDLASRGITKKMISRFETVSWAQFVALSCEYDKVISWG